MSEAETLVVVSKVKKLIRERGGLNTSAEVIAKLTKAVDALCIRGIESAKADGRKTVLERDINIDHI